MKNHYPTAVVIEKVNTETGVSVIVKCPFCAKQHCHGYNLSEDDGIRASHCHSGKYRLVDSASDGDHAHVLYRFYSATGQLLYVGITMNPPQRFKNHRESKVWWDQVSGITVETYGRRSELEQAERRAIQVEKPLHNVAHNGGQRKLAVAPKRISHQSTCTQTNPLGLSDYNIAQFAALPQWQNLAQALNSVALVAHDAGIKGGQDALVEAVSHLARGVGYMDCCRECDRTPDEWIDTSAAPYQTKIHGGSVLGRYRCASGHEWFCWYSLRIPELMF
jgi:predicted GIY-YIG superfamily endonuclease